MSEQKAWGHDALASDLARHLRANERERMVWEDLVMGAGGNIRPDVFTIDCTYQRLMTCSYEVKVSRSDFLHDITSGKWQGYLKHSSCVTFAVPAGLVKIDEIPKGCGLIERHAETWRHKRKPTRQAQPELHWTVWMKLLMDGVQREAERRLPEFRRHAFDAYQAERVAKRVLGEQFARAMLNRDEALQRLQAETDAINAKRRAQAESQRAEHERRRAALQAEEREVSQLLQETAVSLGLPRESSSYAIKQELRRLLPASVVTELREQERAARYDIKRALEARRRIRRLLGNGDGCSTK